MILLLFLDPQINNLQNIMCESQQCKPKQEKNWGNSHTWHLTGWMWRLFFANQLLCGPSNEAHNQMKWNKIHLNAPFNAIILHKLKLNKWTREREKTEIRSILGVIGECKCFFGGFCVSVFLRHKCHHHSQHWLLWMIKWF